jgi:hypothetical protein
VDSRESLLVVYCGINCEPIKEYSGENMNITGPRIYLLIAFLFIRFGLVGEEIKLVLPIRVIDKILGTEKVNPQDFKLFINGSSREVIDVVEKAHKIKDESNLGRNFVLSFYISEYDNKIFDLISYFAHHVLSPGDQLMVLSPLKSYRVKVIPNKVKLVMDIENRLKTDYAFFKKNEFAAEKKLINSINRLKATMADRSRSSDFEVQRYKAINMFLCEYPQEFQIYRNLYLLPRVGKYNQILKTLKNQDGEIWWIHFHQRQTSNLVSITKNMVNQINNYFREYVSTFSRMISRLEDLLNISEAFPIDRLLKDMVDNNVCYNTVFFGGLKSMQPEILFQGSSGLIKLLGDISRSCRGRSIITINPVDGLKVIENHPNAYYELTYTFNGLVEPKTIKILWENKKDLVYKTHFDIEEIEQLIQYHQHEKIKIDGVLIKGRKIRFCIKNFEREAKTKVGIIKVGIDLQHQSEEKVYENTKTLRALKDKISLSLNLPDEYEGDFNLKITVTDLVANRQAVSEHQILL